MKVAIAGDSAGIQLAKILAEHLSNTKCLIDLSISEFPALSERECYANLADRAARSVLDGTYDRAILCCGTGIGVCLAANKVPGIRAAQTHDTYSAERAALSNNAQIITMGSRVIGAELAKVIAVKYLASSYDPKGRSADNVAAINALDNKYLRPA